MAIEKSDADGRFRLKGIPPNKPLIFTVNPDGKPGETSTSAEEQFKQAGAQKIRIILPANGSGKGPVKVERPVPAGGGAKSKPDADE